MSGFYLDTDSVRTAVHTHGIDHARYLAFSYAAAYHNPPAVQHMLSNYAHAEWEKITSGTNQND